MEAALWENLRGHLNRMNTAKLEGIDLTDLEFKRVRIEFERQTGTPFQASQWLRGEMGSLNFLWSAKMVLLSV